MIVRKLVPCYGLRSIIDNALLLPPFFLPSIFYLLLLLISMIPFFFLISQYQSASLILMSSPSTAFLDTRDACYRMHQSFFAWIWSPISISVMRVKGIKNRGLTWRCMWRCHFFISNIRSQAKKCRMCMLSPAGRHTSLCDCDCVLQMETICRTNDSMEKGERREHRIAAWLHMGQWTCCWCSVLLHHEMNEQPAVSWKQLKSEQRQITDSERKRQRERAARKKTKDVILIGWSNVDPRSLFFRCSYFFIAARFFFSSLAEKLERIERKNERLVIRRERADWGIGWAYGKESSKVIDS